jgi:hypothetical protein
LAVRTLLVLLLVLGWTLETRTAEVASYETTSLEYDRDNRDFKISEDEDAEEGDAFEARIRGRLLRTQNLVIATTPAVEIREPGTYKAVVRLKMEGLPQSLGTGIIFAAGQAPRRDSKGRLSLRGFYNRRLLYLNEFAAEGEWQTFELLFDIHRADAFRAARTEAAVAAVLEQHQRTVQRAGEEAVALVREHLLRGSEEPVPVPEKASREVQSLIQKINTSGERRGPVTISLCLPRNEPPFGAGRHSGDRGNSTPFPSLRRLYVDWVRVETVPEPPVVLRQVRAQCAWRRPGEEQIFYVDLHNRSGASQTASVRLRLRHGLDGEETLAETDVEVAHGQYATATVAWTVPEDHRLWGQTVVAEVLQGTEVIGSARTWFTVHPRGNAVLIPWARDYYPLEAHLWHHPYGKKPNVANNHEFWAPTAYDAAGLVPDNVDKPFFAGNSGKLEDFASQRELATWLNEHGIAPSFYCEQHGTGLRAWEFYFDRPEMVVNSNQTPSDLFLKKRMQAWEDFVESDYTLQLSGEPGQGFHFPHVGFVTLNGIYPEVLRMVIDGHLKLMREVPYAMVRWDGPGPTTTHNRDILGNDKGKTKEELDRIQVENFRQYMAEIREEFPTFEHSYNGGIGELMGPQEDPFDFEHAKAVIESDPVYMAYVSDHGYVLGEDWGHSFEVFDDYKIVCRNYLRACRMETAAYKHAGGHRGHMYRDFRTQYTPDDIYQQVFNLLGGAHQSLANYGPLPESPYDLGCYASRFGEFFFDPDLEQLTDLEEKVYVDAQSEVWFTEAGFEKVRPDGSKLYILPVINPPVTEKWLENRYGLLPTPIREPIPMTVAVPEGYSRVEAVYHLENSPYPESKPLPFESDGGEVVFELPELVTFEVVAVVFGK